MRKSICSFVAVLLAIVISTISPACAYDIAAASDSEDAGSIVYNRTGYANTYTNTGDYAKDIIGVALTQVGYQENPSCPDYTKYSYAYWGVDTQYAWCGLFVSWCARQAGIPNSVIRETEHVYYATYENYLNGTGKFAPYFLGTPYQVGSKTPAPGDLFYSTTKQGIDYSTHVGIVWRVTGNYVYTIEGNTRTQNSAGQYVDGVVIRMYNLQTGYQYYKDSNNTSTYCHILFYVHPDYESAEAGKQ